ncbi:MAG: hypothetical protein K2K70_06375 [Lachnospiraceae bacterium]|nr:hypothetical protein [Lachnospiraceae bacterium]
MSVEICKYDRDIYDDGAKMLMNAAISSQSMYDKYLEPAVQELKIRYFQDGAEIRKCNLEEVMKELELLIEWVENHVEGEDLEYFRLRLQRVHEFIPKALQEDDGILYIF